MRVRHRNKGTARHQTGTELQCDDDGEPQMTQQASASTSREDLAASPSSASSDSSTLSAIYPYSVGDKEIVLNNGTISVPQNDLIGTNSGINVVESTDVRIGHETVFNGDVTLIQHVYAQADRGPIGHASEFKKEALSTPPSTGDKILQNFWQYKFIIGPATLLFIALLSTLLVLLLGNSPSTPTFNETNPNTTVYVGNHPVYDRDNWGALPPQTSGSKLTNPTSLVIISHTATPDTCSNFSKCSRELQILQHDHMVGGHEDIGYNFLVGGEGGVYVGRGWERENMLRVASIAVAFIGDFNFNRLTEEAVSAALSLLGEGVASGKLSTDYKLVAENQTSPKRFYSPGRNAFTVIKEWDHYFSGTLL